MKKPKNNGTVTRKLRCNLTDQEKIKAGKELAEANSALSGFENDKTQIVAEFKAKITAQEAQIASLTNKICSGYEFRDVECTVHFDEPQPGEKKIVRTDTDELVETMLMTEEEKQRELPLEEART